MCTKEENIYLMERKKKWRNPFATKKSFHEKKNNFKKDFDKPMAECLYCGKKGHFVREVSQEKYMLIIRHKLSIQGVVELDVSALYVKG